MLLTVRGLGRGAQGAEQSQHEARDPDVAIVHDAERVRAVPHRG